MEPGMQGEIKKGLAGTALDAVSMKAGQKPKLEKKIFNMKRKLLLPGMACAVAGSLLVCVALADHDKAQKDSAISQPCTMMKLSQAQGATIVDRQNNQVGTIRDFLADPDSGRIQFAIVSLADAANKLTAVPWRLFRQQSPNSLALQADRETLRTARTFTADQWPDFTQRDVVNAYYTHYGLTYDRSDVGGRVALPSGVERSSVEVYYEVESENFFPRPQPDGHSTFPYLHRSEKDW
jgi:PRC-barrel domain